MSADLPLVRRLEAMGLRAWPAKNVHYDGAWQLRLTAGHPSKRLNSLSVLDQSDISDIEIRFEKARRHYEAFGRPLLVRETPLTPPALVEFLMSEAAEPFDASIVMTLDLSRFEPENGVELLPSQDVGRFVGAALKVNPVAELTRAGLAEVVTAIKPAHGFFIRENEGGEPFAAGLCVHDFDMAGIEAFAVAPGARRKGHGRELATGMLRWARGRGARTAWLQVTETNAAALALYQSLGFHEAYRYRYWREKAEK
ncbi:GNAT family N-acetyltransferase [Martelella sp. AD-3]|uniref:GNAT family N-acetyltransferase n=1 Tax=Martelella sp. AD-3 TaxID=686597 RepID=UPI0004665D5C|nr:GNAT family N-acetyltransferase [Martelella sp. AD-3]AMM86127.1 GCN5 family acetyltransferase [Martelella sp. AD-3]